MLEAVYEAGLALVSLMDGRGYVVTPGNSTIDKGEKSDFSTQLRRPVLPAFNFFETAVSQPTAHREAQETIMVCSW
jgi:hypothetical protein